MTDQKKIRDLESSIQMAGDLITFFKDHEDQLDKAETKKMIKMLEHELHVHNCWLIHARLPSGW